MTFPILITSAGRRVALMRCFSQSARIMGFTPKLVATEMRPVLSAAARSADAAHAVSRCTTSSYVDELRRISAAESVRLVVPTIDTELEVLSNARGKLESTGLSVVISSPQVVALARDKIAFMRFCEAIAVTVPKTVSASDFYAGKHDLIFPVIFKPLAGSRSIGIARANTPAEVPAVLRPEDYMVQELWVGREFTVNFFVGRDGKLKCAVPHERLEVRDGEVSKGVTRRIPAVLEAAQKVGAALGELGAYGPLCVQGILRGDGVFALFELNARFGGGYPLAHDAGAHFTQWLMEDALGHPCTANDNWKANRLMLRYDDAVFADEA